MKILRALLVALLASNTFSLAHGQTATISILNTDVPELPDFSASRNAVDTLDDRSFLTLLTQNNLEALALTQAAEQRCQQPELQKLAQHFREEQQISLRKIREIAGEYGIDLTPVNAGQRARMLAALGAIADTDFDMAYLELMRVNQMTALRLLQTAAAETALSADMRTLANNLMSVTWSHRHHIQMVINNIGLPRQEVSLRM